MEHIMHTLSLPHTATALTSMKDSQCLTPALFTLIWFAFIIFLLLSIVCYAVADMYGRKQQMFWYAVSFISAVSTVTYLSIAYEVGHIVIVNIDGAHCFYIARYVDVAVTLVVQLIFLQIFACENASDIAYSSAMTLLVVATTEFGSFVDGNNVWLYFVVAIAFQLPILRLLAYYIVSGGTSLVETTMTRAVTGRVSILATLLLMYIVMFDVGYFMSVCAHFIQDTTQLSWSMLLDVAAKTTFALVLLSNRDALDAVAEVITASSAVEGEHSTRSRTSSYHSLGPADRPLKSTITPMRE